MFERGLKPKELNRLESAGADPALVDAIAAEAQTLRWLFLLRGEGYVVTAVIGAAASIWVSAALDLEGWRNTAASAVLPMIIGLLLILPTLEIRAVRREPVRRAARRLAVLAVQAHPGHGDQGDRPWRELQRLTRAGAGFDHPRAALREIAHALDRPKPKPARAPGRDTDALALTRTNANVLSLVALAIAVSALAMMAVLRFS
ncbi:hypothetical protein ACWCOP_13065 [Maricaulaceae bacterium MS644]